MSIPVAVGVIWRPQAAAKTEVLISQRLPHQSMPGVWEFPGGKCESGESVTVALKRELCEELGIEALTMSPLLVIDHVYTHSRVRLHVFEVTAFSGEPMGREGQVVRWVALSDLASYPFPEANELILEKLKK